MDDLELLRQYSQGDSEEAFSVLVQRHVNLVYSTALRHVGNAHHAEEITQAVFVILAKKARRLRGGPVLSGWLYQVARLTAANFLRSEIQRARREQEAHMQSLLNEPEPGPWEQIAPWLDMAMGGLSEKDRNAVVLRFFDGRSMRDVGVALGTSEAAAKKRVSRAVERLRRFFARRRIVLSAVALTATISTNTVQAAPTTLVISAAMAAFKSSALNVSTLAIVKGTLKMMTWTKIKIAFGVGTAMLLVTGAFTVIQSAGTRDGAAGELKGQMVQAYRNVKTYEATVALTAIDRETGATFGKPIEYQIAFDRAQAGFRYDMRDDQPVLRQIQAVCDGKTLWFRDSTPVISGGRNIRPPGLALKTPVKLPLNYTELTAAVPKLRDRFLPIIGLLLGEDPVKVLEKEVPVKAGGLTMAAVPPRAEDPQKRPGLKFTGWNFPPGRKSIDAMTYWLDPQTHLVSTVSTEMRSSENSNEPLRDVEGRIDVRNQKLNLPMNTSMFTFDSTGLKVVQTYSELSGLPPRPSPAKPPGR